MISFTDRVDRWRLAMPIFLCVSIFLGMNAMHQHLDINGDEHVQGFMQALEADNLMAANNIIQQFSGSFAKLKGDTIQKIGQLVIKPRENLDNDKVSLIVAIETTLINNCDGYYQDYLMFDLSKVFLELSECDDPQHFLYYINGFSNTSVKIKGTNDRPRFEILLYFYLSVIESLVRYMEKTRIDCNALLDDKLGKALVRMKKFNDSDWKEKLTCKEEWYATKKRNDGIYYLGALAFGNKYHKAIDLQNASNIVKIAVGKILNTIYEIEMPMVRVVERNCDIVHRDEYIPLSSEQWQTALQLMMRAKYIPMVRTVMENNTEIVEQSIENDKILTRLIELFAWLLK